MIFDLKYGNAGLAEKIVTKFDKPTLGKTLFQFRAYQTTEKVKDIKTSARSAIEGLLQP